MHPTSLRAWFKVDNYNGSPWINSATVAKNGLKAKLGNLTSATPPASGDLWNYNPTLKFDGKTANNGFNKQFSDLDDLLNRLEGTMIVIASYNGINDEDVGTCGYYNHRVGSLRDNEFSIQKHLVWIHPYILTSNSITFHGRGINWSNEIETTPSIRTAQFIRTSPIGYRNLSFKTFNNNLINGEVNIRSPTQQGHFSDNGTKYFGIGEANSPLPNKHFYKGSIAEVIVYAKNISTSERLRTESYLAIKYGITIGTPANPVSYTSSSASTPQNIWTGDNIYQNNIIGIGRDDISVLLQKQSHQRDDSVRIYLGDLETTNKLNQSTFSNNRSYVVMGSNEKKLYATEASNTAMYTGIANSPCGLFSIIERKWKVQRTNMPDVFNIDIKLHEFAKLSLIDPADLRLIVDTDDNLANGWTGCFATGDNGLDISYASGMVNIKGISTVHIPDSLISYITIGSVDRGTPLPIELSSFEAQCFRTNVELKWVTASETNNDFFTIEHSTDGIHFETSAVINGQGSKNSSTSYSQKHYTNQVGINYYRLSQTDFDGKETILNTISTNCEGDIEVIIYPNPTEDGVFIALNSPNKVELEVQVFNLTGQSLSQHTISGSSWIQLPEEHGIYLIKYILNGKENVEKVVKY